MIRIPFININIDPRTPEGKAAVGSVVRFAVAFIVGAGVVKAISQEQVNEYIAFGVAALTFLGSLKSSQSGDAKLVETKTNG